MTAPGPGSDAEVTCQPTALTAPAVRQLTEFADGCPACLQSWQHAITTWLDRSRECGGG